MRAGLPAGSPSGADVHNPFFGHMSLTHQGARRLLTWPLKLPFMDHGPDIVDETTRAALPRPGRRDAWLEQRLHFLIGEQARLKAGPPLRRFLRGALAAYRRFLLTADPAHRFHCWAIIRTISAGLDQLEHRAARPEVAGSAPDGPDPGRPLVAGLTDRAR